MHASFFAHTPRFDVFLANTRGNKYSNGHVSLDNQSDAYWSFNIDDIASLDLPSTIDYILKLTKSSSLSYIGYSQGTAIGFAAMAEGKLKDKINIFIAMAPVMKPRGTGIIFLVYFVVVLSSSILFVFLWIMVKLFLVCFFLLFIYPFIFFSIVFSAYQCNYSQIDCHLSTSAIYNFKM